MVLLSIIREALTWIYLYPTDELTPKWKKFTCILIALTIVVLNICSAWACLAFIIKDQFNNLYDTLYAVEIFGAYICAIIIYVSAILLRSHIKTLFEILADIYKMCKFSIQELSNKFRY